MLKTTIKIFFIIAVVFAIFQLIDADELFELLKGISLQWFLLVVIIAFIDLCVMGHKWGILLRAGGIKARSLGLILVYLRSKVLMLFVPSTLGVDAYKAIYLKNTYGVGLSTATAAIFVERLLGALSSIALMLLLFYFFTRVVPIPFPNLSVFAALIGFVMLNGALFWLLSNLSQLKQKSQPWANKGRPYRILATIIGHFNDIAGNRRAVFYFFYYSIVEKLFTGIAIYCSAMAIGDLEIDFLFIIAATPIFALLERLPISFAAIGVREGLFVFLFMPFGYEPEVAISIALVLRFAELAQMALCTLFWLSDPEKKHTQRTN